MTRYETLGIFLNPTIYTIEIHIFDMVDAIFTSGIHFIPVSRTGSGQFTPFHHRQRLFHSTPIISGDSHYPKSTFNNILTNCCTSILQSLIDLRYQNRPSLLVAWGAQVYKEPSGQPWVVMPCQWTPKTFHMMLAKLWATYMSNSDMCRWVNYHKVTFSSLIDLLISHVKLMYVLPIWLLWTCYLTYMLHMISLDCLNSICDCLIASCCSLPS
jgi:hypothetical protein